jgi:energy-coupling factor transporter ATP-binding protein EcfA2
MTADIPASDSLFPWEELTSRCKADPRIRFYVARESSRGRPARQLVDWSEVLRECDQDRAFADATLLESYGRFAEYSYASTRASVQLERLTAGLSLAALRRFFSSRAVLLLTAVLLLLAVFEHDHAVFAAQLGALALAPAAGLTWRNARAKSSFWLIIQAVLTGAAGLAVLVTPLVLGSAFSSWPGLLWSWFLLVAYLGVVAILAQDHVRRPLFREPKLILLLPSSRGADRRAQEARRAWLDDAVDNAVMPELVQAINRLLQPELERRLLVQDATGLRTIYHPGHQVSTRAARQVADALRRSDGASIAVSGPRGCGKSSLLKELARAESHFSVVISAPTRYAPKEFLVELFQRLCTAYITDRGFEVEQKRALRMGRQLSRFMRSVPGLILRTGLAAVFLSLFISDLITRAVGHDLDLLGDSPRYVWTDKRVLGAIILGTLFVLVVPKRKWRSRSRSDEPDLVARARSYLLRLQAEQTATLQVGGGLPVMQAVFSRAVALRSLPWTLPELIGHLSRFIEAVAVTEKTERKRQLLICIDEVDRIGPQEEAMQFLNEIKAIFSIPHCYFVVAIAEEPGAEFGGRAIVGRSLADNAFDEVISLEPMSFELSRQLLQRRVPGFTDPFVWLSLVLSGGLPRELLRVATQLVEITREFDYELELPAFADRLVGEEILEALVATRSQIARLSPGPEWGSVLDRLRLLAGAVKPGSPGGDLGLALKELADLRTGLPGGGASGDAAITEVITRLAAFALLAKTTCDVFKDGCFDISGMRDPDAGTVGAYTELAAGRRELSVSSESCRAVVDRIRLSLGLDQESLSGCVD